MEKAVGGDGLQDIGKERINERIPGEVGGVDEVEGQGGGGYWQTPVDLRR